MDLDNPNKAIIHNIPLWYINNQKEPIPNHLQPAPLYERHMPIIQDPSWWILSGEVIEFHYKTHGAN